MRTLLSFLGMALLAASAHAQDLPPLPGDWVERPPINSEGELYCANWADTEWRVSRQNGVLGARPLERGENAETARIQFADGELIGRDYGEWGGELVWQPTIGTAIQLISDNTSQVFLWKERVFAAGGLAHMGSSGGYVAELERTNEGWRVARRTDLSGPVYAVDNSSPEEVVLVTPDGAHKMDATGAIRRIFASSNWWAQYPNSVLRLANGDILVGMRYSISRLRPAADGYAETLLVPAACQRLTNARSNPLPSCTCTTA